jgi:hypothetical protein
VPGVIRWRRGWMVSVRFSPRHPLATPLQESFSALCHGRVRWVFCAKNWQLLGLCLPEGAEPPRGRAGVVSAQTHEAPGPAAEPAGAMPSGPVPPQRARARRAHPEPAGLGPRRCRGRGASVLGCWQRRGGTAGPTAAAACTATTGLRLAEVASARGVYAPGPGAGRAGPTFPTGAASAPSLTGPITLGRKRPGKRRAGKPHAPCAGAGAGNVAMVAWGPHAAIERAALETRHLQQARLPSTLPGGGNGETCLRQCALFLPNG